jgi:hypothetical protein
MPFDGATREVGDRKALMFGIDTIARLKEPLSPLVIHELFHVYHGERVPKAPRRSTGRCGRRALASYVSRRLNPEVAESQVCCLPPAADIDAARARSVRARSTGSTARKEEDYRRYFLGGKEKIDIPQPLRLPPRVSHRRRGGHDALARRARGAAARRGAPADRVRLRAMQAESISRG